ncbi:MAG: hypothetical protein ACFFAK_17515 [Promethearchaeota archaeon]
MTESEVKFVESMKLKYEQLNSKENFKEKWKDEKFKILLNPKDSDHAALISVEKGNISVQGIKNNPKNNIEKESLNWDALMQTTLEIFAQMNEGKLSRGDITKKMITGKIKLKNPTFLAKLSDLDALLKE